MCRLPPRPLQTGAPPLVLHLAGGGGEDDGGAKARAVALLLAPLSSVPPSPPGGAAAVPSATVLELRGDRDARTGEPPTAGALNAAIARQVA
jgi:hypothetical protein